MNLALAHTLSTETHKEQGGPAALEQGFHELSEAQQEAQIIERILLEATDLSSLSPELLRRALDLGVWYHFNPFRTTAVRLLDLPENVRILELGCGAGTVTRYLAEEGFLVTGFESNPDLARCARLRCQGLRNVDIVEEYLDVMMLDEKFDLVVCLDPTLIGSEFYEPGIELFAMCRKLLKSSGSLILAVGNTIGHVADTHIAVSRDAVRGRGAPLGSLRDSLVSAGFPQHDTFISFPHHAAPHVLIEPLHSRMKRVDWLSSIRDTFKGSSRGMAQLEKWWRTVHAEYLDSALAPGWVLVAHAHHVHAPLWSEWALGSISAVSSAEDAQTILTEEGILQTRMIITDSELLPRILGRCAPEVRAQQEILDHMAAGELRVKQLSKQQGNLRSMMAHKRLAEREKLRAERRARKSREAELDLVLNHSRAVGAMWGEMKRENAKLEECVVGLRERYEASEESLLDLAAKVHEAELELRTVKSSWLWRVGAFARRLWFR